jgi:hypothetical protein
MLCPSCNSEVEEGADLCLECGEPMGDSPAAKVARAEQVAAVAPQRGGANSCGVVSPKSGTAFAQKDPAAVPPLSQGARAESPVTTTLKGKRSALNVDHEALAREKRDALAETVRGKKRSPLAEPEAVRCPGCGTPSHGERCPACGTRLRRDQE